MKRILFTLALCLPLVLTACTRTSATTMSDDMMEDTIARTGIPGDMLAGVSPNASIVENAMAVSELSVLVEAIKAADLVDVLSGPGPFTVFAPINNAFDLIDADEMVAMEMSAEEKEDLADLLKGHVMDSKVMFNQLNNGVVIETLSGADYTVARKSDDLLEKRIGEADILAYDIESSNGVIHVINLVLDDEGFFSQ